MYFSNQLLFNMTPAKLTGYINMFRTALLFLQDSVNICPLYMKHPDFFLNTAKHTVLSIVTYNTMCSSWHSIPCLMQITQHFFQTDCQKLKLKCSCVQICCNTIISLEINKGSPGKLITVPLASLNKTEQIMIVFKQIWNEHSPRLLLGR